MPPKPLQYRHVVFHSNNEGPYNYYYVDDNTFSDPYDDEKVRNYDQTLYQTLNDIFRGRTSDQIKQLFRTPRNQHTNKNSILNLIMKQAPDLGKLLLKRSELPLLWIVVLSYYQNSAELLVRSGADLNELYGLDDTSDLLNKQSSLLHMVPSMYPSSWNERFFNLLIEHGANLEARDVKASTVLHKAAAYGRVKQVEILLKKGIDVNAVRESGITAFHKAAFSTKFAEIMPLLMRHGADINARDSKYGYNIMHFMSFARVGEQTDLARVLIEKGVSCKLNILDQPIHTAALGGKNELVNLFLDHGANVNANDRYNEFPLYIAAQGSKNPAVLLTLLKRGANIDQQTLKGMTALLGIAVSRSSKNIEEKTKILLSAGADMFVKNRFGRSIFDVLSSMGYLQRPCTNLMVKTLALKACLEPSIESKCEKLIEVYPVLLKLYQDCISEINQIKTTKFIKSGIFFELLTKCQCQIVPLMRNHEFEEKFKLYDLSVFPLFSKDICDAFERAENYYRSTMLEQENLINEAVYNTLPHMIVRKMAHYAINCEICEMKKIVEASRVSPSMEMPR